VTDYALPVEWNEPDPELLDQLMRVAGMAADTEALRQGPPSRILDPDGSQQGETGHERTQRVTRAALRVLLANGLVTALPPGEWPEYTAIDPPGDWARGGR
jgi:hypothetical protein